MSRAGALVAADAEAAPRRPGDSRVRLLRAAFERFCADGYAPVSVEDIASAAGVSRMTFYRHFAGKAELAAELFHEVAERAKPRMLAIRDRDYTDHASVTVWIADLFAADRASRSLLRVFTQASTDEEGFTARAHSLLGELIAGLGATIPAFALDPEAPSHRRRWLEAWLLIFELLDQSNHAARESGIANDPLVIDILADRFVDFVRGS